MAQAEARNQLQRFVKDGYMSDNASNVLAGGIGGGFQGLVLSPTLLLKTRVMTDPIFRENMSMVETTKQSMRVGMRVIRNEGLSALMKGSMVFSLKRVGDWTTRFLFAGMFEWALFTRKDPQMKLSTAQRTVASLAGGTLSALVTIPVDVMVAQIQQASSAGSKVGFFSTFAKQYKQGGIQQIAGFATRGFGARVAHVAFTTAIMKTGATYIYDKLYR